jgi:hypothetical protein
MGRHTRIGLGVLGAALGLGILGDQLLRATPWGPNVVVWIAALALACFAIARWQTVPLTGGGRWLIVPALFFAGALAWRDSATLRAINLLTLAGLLALATVRTRAGRLRVAGLVEYAADGLLAGWSIVAGTLITSVRDIVWEDVPSASWSEHAGAVMRGLVIAVPLLLVFGGLLVAADAMFQELVANVFRVDLGSVLSHLVQTAVWFWIAAGLLWGVLQSRLPRVYVDRASTRFSVGMVEIGTVLGLLDALFLVFVAVQFRYLFGGVPPAPDGSGIDPVATYARRGFFELVTVALLVLPLLLGTHWLARRERPADGVAFNLLAGLMVLLLFAIMSSAFRRMDLYRFYYGLTELRLYTTACMAWLAVVFGWLMLTVLRGRRDQFAFGVLVSGCVLVAGLNALNPDALIVRTNVGREVAGESSQPFDAVYAAGLSADAVPELVASLNLLNGEQRAVVAQELLARWSPPTTRDWRTWNWGRERAWAAVGVDLVRLQQVSR